MKTCHLPGMEDIVFDLLRQVQKSGYSAAWLHLDGLSTCTTANVQGHHHSGIDFRSPVQCAARVHVSIADPGSCATCESMRVLGC